MSLRPRPPGLLLCAALLSLAAPPLAAWASGDSLSPKSSSKQFPHASQGSGAAYQRLETLTAQAQAALKVGDPGAASALAGRLLRENTDKSSWNYGNVVYDANQILGLAALRQGNVSAAKSYLLAAGRTPGSPQLDSFGPDMTLAQMLLAQGQKQTVLTFLDLVAKFWATPKPGMERFSALSARNGAQLHKWERQIRAGKAASLDRFDFSSPFPTLAARPDVLAAGTAAPDFTVQDRSGSPLKLSDYKGKVVVLDFWATWCGPCQQSLPHTNEVAKLFAGKGVVTLAVNVWDNKAAFDGWLPKHPEYDAITFALDPTQEHGKDVATLLYHVSGIPTQFVIGKDGKVFKSFVGYGGPTDDLADAITAASAAQSASAR